LTAASGFLLFAAGVLFLMVGAELRSREQRGVHAARGFAILFGAAAFDEVAMLHETLAARLAQSGLPRPLGADHDVWVFAVYGVVAIACAVGLWPVASRHRGCRWVLVSMFAFAVGSEAIDLVPWDALSRPTRDWLGPCEEGLKTLAAVAAVIYGHALRTDISATAARR
jgi:hypothetical protein